MNLTFKWTVTTNVLADGTYIYEVYRNRFKNEPDHSGNREFKGGIFTTKEEAQKICGRTERKLIKNSCAIGYTGK